MPTAILPDGSRKELPPGSSPLDLAKTIGEGLASATIGARVDEALDGRESADAGGRARGQHRHRPAPRQKGRSKWRDERHEKDALYLLRHSTAHVMAEAIQRLRPDATLAYGPPLETGFYYDIAIDPPLSSDDFGKIEAEMAKIVAEDRPFRRYGLPTDEGMERLKSEGNKYKVDNAERAVDGGADSLSWYVTGEKDQNWEDLCQGPHVPATGRIGAFKLTSTASSHWHGDVTSDRFQRVYGTAFFSQADLDDHMEKLAEAKKRDHRVLGPQLGLYAIDDKVGQGLVLWKPKGAVVRQELQDFIGEHLRRQGYSQVFTPHIGKLGLYRTSGHYPYYRDSQFPPLIERETISMLADEGCTCGDLAAKLDKPATSTASCSSR